MYGYDAKSGVCFLTIQVGLCKYVYHDRQTKSTFSTTVGLAHAHPNYMYMYVVYKVQKHVKLITYTYRTRSLSSGVGKFSVDISGH